MKKILLIAFLFISSLYSQTYYYTFSELNGIEDNSDKTHLFYRIYTFEASPVIGDYFENSIYHFDLEKSTDTLFLFEGGRIGEFVTIMIDLEFWNNNPSEYIYIGMGCGVDC
ncbi:MAG TPA: hypothetical protein VGA29_03655, partial [Ignavibacteriaceae bacterium]